MPKERGSDYGALAIAAVAVFFYGLYRVRYVACCDPAAYYLESLVLRGDNLRGWLDPSVPIQGPLAPLCAELLPNGKLVSFFPPGFPLLLAITGAAGAPFFTNPILGAGSGLALYALVKRRGPPLVALGTMVAWLCSPAVFFFSTQVMSDLPTAAFAVLTLLALDRRRPVLAGLAYGLSIAIRPTQLLLAPTLIVLERDARTLGRVLLGALSALALVAALLHHAHGGFFLPYASNVHLLTGEYFFHQVSFLGRQTLLQHAPIVLFAALAAGKSFRRSAPYLVWFGTFLLFYGLWASPLDEWWYIRFVLPALPGVYVLAADGALALAGDVRTRRFAIPGAVVSVAGYAVWATFYSPAAIAHTPATDEYYAEEAMQIARRVPNTALVGAVNETTPLRLYGHLQSFLWFHPDMPSLVDWAVRHGRPVYAVLDDEERASGASIQFELSPIEKLSSGRTFYKLVTPKKTVDIGTPSAHRYLLEGWSDDERAGAETFAWAIGQRALFEMPNDLPDVDTRVRIALSPFAREGVTQHLDVSISGNTLASRDLPSGDQFVDVVVPARRVHDVLELRFAYAFPPTPEGEPGDHRRLAAAFDWISFTAVP
jgi:hypothetical protein